MSSDKIEVLYKNFGVLADAKDKISEHEAEYSEIIGAVKGSINDKKLASQFITRFFKHFPSLMDQAIEALFDLCEDEDVSVRKQAIKDLPSLSIENNEYTAKVTDILGQLLQTDDTTELSVVQSSIMTLFKNDIKGALKGMFNLIEISNTPVREKCLKFLVPKIKMLGRDIMTKEMEEYTIDQCKKILRNVTGDEFMQVMDLLAWSRLSQSLAGQKELVEIVKHHAELSKQFDPNNPEDVDRVIYCSLHCVPYLCSAIPSTPFVNYICEQVLPQLDKIPVNKEEPLDNQLEALKLLAELSPFYVTQEYTPTHVTNILESLFSFLPSPPEVLEEKEENEPEFKYSYIESLLYTLHHIVKHDAEFILKDADRFKEFKKRLQYMARWSMAYTKKLRDLLKGLESNKDNVGENKIKLDALKTIANINTMVKEFFHNPPSFKSSITLSFKPTKEQQKAAPEEANGNSTNNKRRAPISFGNGENDGVSATNKFRSSESGKNRAIYTPPSGKFSTKISYQQKSSGGNSFRGRNSSGGSRGGFRGGFKGNQRRRY